MVFCIFLIDFLLDLIAYVYWIGLFQLLSTVFYFCYGPSEQTFIVLDKRLVVGEFVHGDPHDEGL